MMIFVSVVSLLLSLTPVAQAMPITVQNHSFEEPAAVELRDGNEDGDLNGADRARGLGMRVIACDPHLPDDVAAKIEVELVSVDELLAGMSRK